MTDNIGDRPLFWGTRGPIDARIVLVGESWGQEEEREQKPFVGESGRELDRMIREAGIDPTSILYTNVVSAHPPGNDMTHFFEPNEKGRLKWQKLHPQPLIISEINRLLKQIAFAPRSLVIAAGNYALWATTNLTSVSSVKSTDRSASILAPGGIVSWRGSMLDGSLTSCPRILPILHPAAILRAWYQRAVTVHDLRTRIPQALENDWRPGTPPVVLAPPSFDEACAHLREWVRRLDGGEPLRLAHDIETFRGLMTCMGFADSPTNALVIPFVKPVPRGLDSYWPIEQEGTLVHLIAKVLFHPNILIEGQNYIYDTQYIQRYWGGAPRLSFDTMLAHHLLFPGTPKSLDYISSLYCRYHWYWKEDLKEWDQSINFETNLQYNAIDVMRTFECSTVLRRLIVEMNQTEQWEWERRKALLALEMMNRGVRIDRELRARMAFELLNEAAAIQNRLHRMIPQSWSETKSKKPWFSSSKQTQSVLYDSLGLKPKVQRKTGNRSVDDEALTTLSKEYPYLAPMLDLMRSERSIGVFHDNFLSAAVDHDGRMRSSFNTAGTETFRWSSSKNAFGGGTNFQNIPKGEED